MKEQAQFLQKTLAALLGVGVDDICPDTPFDEQGMDSLIGLRFARKIQDGLRIQFDPEWLYDHPSITRLAQFLDAQLFSQAAAPQ